MNTALPLVDLSRALPGGRRWRPLSALAERLLALDQLNALYERHRQGEASAMAFCRRMLDGLGVSTSIDPQDLQRLAAIQGPVLVVANHPLGGREALFLHLILGAVRPDYRILANQLIGQVPEVREKLILVDPFGGSAAAQANRQGLREALRWLAQGGSLGVFPSGELSYWQSDEKRVADPAWAAQVARLLRRSAATVVPLYFSGQSSAWLQALARVHPALKTPWLVRELMQGPARSLEARLGHPLPAQALPALDDRALAGWLRERCYALKA